MTADQGTLSRFAAGLIAALGPEAVVVEPMYGAAGSLLYDKISREDRTELREFARLAQEHPGKVLDLGCGSGRVSLFLARRRSEVTALDNSPTMLDILRDRLRAEPPAVASRVHVVRGDMTDFRSEERFSLILVSVTTIGLLPEEVRTGFFASVSELLAEDGVLAITTATFDTEGESVPSLIDTHELIVIPGAPSELLTVSQTVNVSEQRRAVTLIVSSLTANGTSPRLYASSVHVIEPETLIKEATAANLDLMQRRVIARASVASSDAICAQVLTMLTFRRAES